MFETDRDLIRCLVSYTDWWQPATTSLVAAPPKRRGPRSPSTFRTGFVDHLDDRRELEWRLSFLDDEDRKLLYLFYVAYLPIERIAEQMGVTPRTCYRRRTRAIERLIAPEG